MTGVRWATFAFVLFVPFAVDLPGGTTDALAPVDEDCCGCTPAGGEHEFLLCGHCNVEEPPSDCKLCEGGEQPDGHVGCHNNELPGSCAEHPACAIVTASTELSRELLDLLRRGDDLQVIRFVTHRTLSDRVFINWARGAVQLRHCNDDSVITAHYPLSPAALAAVHLAIDQ